MIIKNIESKKLSVGNNRGMLFNKPDNESEVIIINIIRSTMLALPIFSHPTYNDEFLLCSRTSRLNPVHK